VAAFAVAAPFQDALPDELAQTIEQGCCARCPGSGESAQTAERRAPKKRSHRIRSVHRPVGYIERPSRAQLMTTTRSWLDLVTISNWCNDYNYS
jgi:hypothetical protein